MFFRLLVGILGIANAAVKVGFFQNFLSDYQDLTRYKILLSATGTSFIWSFIQMVSNAWTAEHFFATGQASQRVAYYAETDRALVIGMKDLFSKVIRIKSKLDTFQVHVGELEL